MTSRRETTFDIVMRLAFRNHQVQVNNAKNHFRMICPVCNHTPADGRFTTFAIHQNQNQWYCFACDTGGGPEEMLNHLNGSAPIAFEVKASTKPSTRIPGEPIIFQGASVKALCAQKGLDEARCRDDLANGGLGWRDGRWYKTPCVEFPIYDEDGIEVRTRYRVGIDEGDRMRSRRSQILYGLWAMDRIRELGWVIVVEGETDFATLYLRNYPVIAVPGANGWKKEYAKLFKGIDVWVWKEPDQGGITLSSKISATIKDLRIIEAPPEAKDPCELAQLLGDQFETRMGELILAGQPVPGTPVSFFDAQYFPFASPDLTFEELKAAVGLDHAGQGVVRNTVGVPGAKRSYRIRDKTPAAREWQARKNRKRGLRPNLWEEAGELFPAPSGIRPWTKHVALYSAKDYAMLSTSMLSNSWRNPANAQFKRARLYFNILPRINGPIVYERRVAFDDWTSKLHESLEKRINRGKKAISIVETERDPGYLWFDNSLSRGYYLYLTDVPDLPEFVEVMDAKTLLIGALNSIRTPGPEEPGRFRPYGGSANWKQLADSTGEEDQNRWDVIAVGPTARDLTLLEAECIGAGLDYEFVPSYWRSQVGDGMKIMRISREMAVDFCIGQHLILTKGALIQPA